MKNIRTKTSLGRDTRTPKNLKFECAARSFSLLGVFYKTVALIALLLAQSCFQNHNLEDYSLYHVRTYNQFSEPKESYIKKHANIVLHVSSQKLDREFEMLDALFSEGRVVAKFEASSLLIRHSDRTTYRLGSSSDCPYLIISHDNRIACDKSLYTSVFTQFDSPLSERD